MRRGDMHLKKQEGRKWGTFYAVLSGITEIWTLPLFLLKTGACSRDADNKWISLRVIHIHMQIIIIISVNEKTAWQLVPLVGHLWFWRSSRQTDNYTSHYTHTLTFSGHIIRSTTWLTHGISSIASLAQVLLHHKSVVKTSLCVAAPLVTWSALTFSIKYLPPRPTVAFSSAANQTQMDIYNWQQMERT